MQKFIIFGADSDNWPVSFQIEIQSDDSAVITLEGDRAIKIENQFLSKLLTGIKPGEIITGNRDGLATAVLEYCLNYGPGELECLYYEHAVLVHVI